MGLWLYLESWSHAPRSSPPVREISLGLMTGTDSSLALNVPPWVLWCWPCVAVDEMVRVQTRRSPRLSESQRAVLELAPWRMYRSWQLPQMLARAS